jgi:UDP-2,3-diacylglucosamine hydrolase
MSANIHSPTPHSPTPQSPISQSPISQSPICYVVSDLHLFSQRSLGHHYEDEIYAAAGQADHFVLAGDIFDFHWTTLNSIQDTVQAACGWLSHLVETHPTCQFHYLLGNHDNHRYFVERMGGLAQRADNFVWYPYLLHMGSSVFLHGDAANPGMTPERLPHYRHRWSQARMRTPLQHQIYDAATRINLHVAAIRMASPRRRVARQLLAYLDSHGHAPETGLRDVYFGHTHRAMRDYPFQGVRFHNCGAPMPGLNFEIIKARL